MRKPVYSMVTWSPFCGDGPSPFLIIVLETPMIAFVFEKLRVFVNVARVVVAKRGRERAMEVNILRGEGGVRMEGLARHRRGSLADRRPVEAGRAYT